MFDSVKRFLNPNYDKEQASKEYLRKQKLYGNKIKLLPFTPIPPLIKNPNNPMGVEKIPTNVRRNTFIHYD